MLILTDYSKPHILESIDEPLITRHHWVFSGPLLDFAVMPITYLEETRGPTIGIMVEGFKFMIPATWNILICDKETSMVDCVPVSNCSQASYQALLMSPNDMKIRMSEVIVDNLLPNHSCVHPMVNKGTMMCHPIGPEKRQDDVENILCVLVGPYDLYSKYLNGKTIGELMY